MNLKKPPLVFVLFCTFVLVLGLAFSSKPIYRKVKQWRGYYFLKQAEKLADKNQLDQALYKATLAYQLNPKDAATIRFLAYHLSLYKRIEALGYWQALLLDPETNKNYPLDRQQFIDYCLNINYLEAATPYIQELLRIETLKLEDYLLLIRYWQKTKQLDLALSLAEKAYRAYPKEPILGLSLAQLYLYQKDKKSTQEAFELLLNMLDRPETTARINAYTLLAQNFSLDASLKQKILSDGVWADPQYGYTLASLKLRLFPATRNSIIQETIQSKLSEKIEDTLLLLQWLNGEGAFKEALELVPKNIALKSKHYILPYLDALAALNQWDTLSDILFQENLPLDSFLLNIFRTRLGLELKDPLLTASQWNHTLSMAKNDPNQLLFLGSYFEKLSQLDFALEAYKPLLEQPQFALLSAQHILAISRSQGYTRDALLVYQSLNRHFPEDLEPQIAVLYTELLLGENILVNRDKAHKLLEKNPDKPYLAHLLALAYLKNDQAQAAMAAYETYRPPLEHAPAGFKSVYVAVCFANHRQKEAQTVFDTIAIEDLYPEERDLLAPYLSYAKGLPPVSLRRAFGRHS